MLVTVHPEWFGHSWHRGEKLLWPATNPVEQELRLSPSSVGPAKCRVESSTKGEEAITFNAFLTARISSAHGSSGGHVDS